MKKFKEVVDVIVWDYIPMIGIVCLIIFLATWQS